MLYAKLQGTMARVLYMAPACSISMAGFEFFKSFLDKHYMRHWCIFFYSSFVVCSKCKAWLSALLWKCMFISDCHTNKGTWQQMKQAGLGNPALEQARASCFWETSGYSWIGQRLPKSVVSSCPDLSTRVENVPDVGRVVRASIGLYSVIKLLGAWLQSTIHGIADKCKLCHKPPVLRAFLCSTISWYLAPLYPGRWHRPHIHLLWPWMWPCDTCWRLNGKPFFWNAAKAQHSACNLNMCSSWPPDAQNHNTGAHAHAIFISTAGLLWCVVHITFYVQQC